MGIKKTLENDELGLKGDCPVGFPGVRTIDLLTYVLNSVHEGIEIVDNDGIIRYVNSAFTRITGVQEIARLGQNIFDRVPNGLLTRTLRTGESFKGQTMTIPESGIEIVTNTYPIIISGMMAGAVAIFYDLRELHKIMAESLGSQINGNPLERVANLVGAQFSFDDIKGNSAALLEAIRISKRAAETDFTVLLCGESGTGKELFAHAIHLASRRAQGPFAKVNCVAIPETLLESELFGYEKGAFTGASRGKAGIIELAHNGTLFLDEIGDMALSLQGKILRVLEDREIQKVGGTSTTKVDFRVVAATNQDLSNLVKQGKFREDLYYRLSAILIRVPPLRERKEDIPLLVNHFINKLRSQITKRMDGVTDSALELLKCYDWPGNVRELRNLLERASLVTDSTFVDKNDILNVLPDILDDKKAPYVKGTYNLNLSATEQALIINALEKHGWTYKGKKSAAKALGISVRTLYNKIQKYRLSPTSGIL